jgi:hypothetical protein
MAGTISRGPGWYPGIDKSQDKPSTSLFGDPATFTAAAQTQAGDYDQIMKDYSDFLSRSASNPLTSTNVTPQMARYNQSADVTGSLANLSDLTKTGGYSEGDIANIRERDISPIRSIYANAQQNVERQRALAGGYSPNFNATQAEMARNESSAIGDRTTAANAGIAEMVARGKLSAASPYASASATANAAQTESDRANANIINQINESNANRALEAQRFGRANILGAISGKASLYGTTPALSSTFGNQVVQAGQLGQTQQQLEQQKQRDQYGAISRFV